MKTRTGWVIVFILLCIAASSCASKPRVFVAYDSPGALSAGDRVYWENLVIGSVGEVEKNAAGRAVVPLLIKGDFRPAVTDRSRFVVEPDPQSPGRSSVKMVQLSPGGVSLPEGAVVQGSTSFSLLQEKGKSGTGLPKVIQDLVDRLNQEVRSLPEQQWLKDLERQIDAWIALLQVSGEQVRRYVKEVLPQIQQIIEEALQRLRKLGREQERKSLEQKFEELKRTLDSKP